MLDYNVSYRNKDKSIQCIISYKDNDGKWRQRSKQGFKTQKESKEWQSDIIKELKKTIKTPTEYRAMTFGEFKNIYIEDKKREYEFNTMRTYENAFKRFEKLDGLLVSEISYIDISPCVNKMIDDKMSSSTIRTYISKIKAVFNHAIDKYEIITINPVKSKDYKVKDEKDNKIKALTELELNDLLSKLEGKDYFITMLASKCGLRLGEIVGITADVIDFKSGEIRIEKQWKRLTEKGYGFGTLKTKNSYRAVPIPVNYISELQEYVNSCVRDINNRIFPDWSSVTTSRRTRDKYRRRGHDITIHDLRHTYATSLIAHGFDFKTIAELTGDTVQVIINTYSHFTDDMMNSAKEKINKVL